MPNRTHEQALDSKMKLMDTALSLFIRKGYTSVSINEICTEAGLTKGAFYYHFSSKEEIYRQLLVPRLDEYIREYYHPEPGDSTGNRLCMLARCVFDVTRSMGRDFIAQDFIRFISCRSSNIYEENRLYTQILSGILKEGIETNTLNQSLDLNNQLMLFACLMTGFLVRWCSANDEDERRIDWDTLLHQEISLMAAASCNPASE